MPKKIPFLALGVLLILATALMAGVGDSPKVTAVTLEPVEKPQPKGSMAACTMVKHDGSPAYYFGGIVQGDQYVTYFNPLDCGQSPTYPFEITDLSFPLYDDGSGVTWPVQLDIVVYDLAQPPDSCSGPGQERCRFTITCDQATWSYPNVGTATFPTPCCVDAPFYIGVQYTDQGAGPYPSILMDAQTADTCDNWGYRGGWLEWFDFWTQPGPGYLIYWVDGETNSPNCEPEIDTCEYYKAGYIDYCPNGMPDFDQKQDGWISPFNQSWSWCGPVALANCIWWFDSKFESNPIPPPTVNDHYPLVQDYFGGVDDHDVNNVMPFIQLLKPMCFTDVAQPGTLLPDLEIGFHSWITAMGLPYKYKTYVVIGPQFQEIRDSILSSQDVILLLGFYELIEGDPQNCQWLGGHYVTAAGVCLDETDICISDPYFDGNEGEPPIGVHGSAVHNDAALVSGPHGTHHHDRYSLMPKTVCPGSPATWMFLNYPSNWNDIWVFENQNPIMPMPPVTYFGGPVVVTLDAALIICPKLTCCNHDGIRGDVNMDNMGPNVSDLTRLVSYIKNIEPTLPCFEEADVNVTGTVNVSDVTYLAAYIKGTGPAPLACP
jgi:hypothetical protein